jgi:adhesin transport system membrane fusion protein
MTPIVRATPAAAAPMVRETPSAVSADLLADAPRLLHLANLCLAALVGAFVLWAAFSRLEEVTVAQGRVVPAAKTQVVQSLEGGIVKSIWVREGQLVEEGAVLLQIDPTVLDSNLAEVHEKIIGLRYQRVRLLAEANGGELVAPAGLGADRPDLLIQQQAELEARGSEVRSTLAAIAERIIQRKQEVAESKSKIASISRSLELARAELALTKPLVEQGAAAKVELIRLESRVAELEGAVESAQLTIPRLEAAIAEAENESVQRLMGYRLETLRQLSQVETDLAALEQSVKGEADRVERTELRSPVKGIVQRLNVTTPRQVVKPGESIVEIVPFEGTLLVEAQVATRDIAFVRPQQEAVVKITAYEFGLYGSLKGRVERISADAITTEKGDSYYLIEVRTDQAHLEKDGKQLPIIPGMVAEVNLLTGERSVLQYLMKPFTRLRYESLRER